jgi:hypothetical protein
VLGEYLPLAGAGSRPARFWGFPSEMIAGEVATTAIEIARVSTLVTCRAGR